ncbi:hypothetical protein MASR2M74_25250 [Paracoccaceae bacterium]
MRHVISLTTIPPRFASLGATLQALVAQSSRPEAVELWLPRRYRRFPGYGGALPDLPEGVTLRLTDEDLGPATKVLPAARARRGEAVEILFCDDDHIYGRHWAAGLLAARARHPEAAVAAAATTLAAMGRPWSAPGPLPRAKPAVPHTEQRLFKARRALLALRHGGRGRIPLMAPFRTIERAGYVDLFEGYGGVALSPDMLDDAAYDIPPVLWSVDDVWLSGHLARRGIPIWTAPGLHRGRACMASSRTEPLYAAIIQGNGRRDANRACIDHFRQTYGIWGGSGSASQST